MKKISSIIIAVLLVSSAAFAVPAWRGLVQYTQPDGTVIMLQKHGDEFCHWTSDVNGQVMEKGADGFWRPVSTAALSSRKALAHARRERINRTRRANSGHIAVGQKHFLVILVEFTDVKFKSATANEDFHNLLNQQGYSVNGATGCARDFYYENSHGYFEPVFDVFGPVTLEHNMAYYGANDDEGYDVKPEDAVIEGCTALDSQIDFSIYDNDKDGQVDLVFMYYAGYGEAETDDENTIWPHQWEIAGAGKSLSLDGKKINSYACTNELVGYGVLNGKMCGIGTACHEFGHAMGLPDFYDTDYKENGEAGGLYDYSLMCSGSYNNNGRTPPYFNIEERIMLGWLGPEVIEDFPVSGNYALTTVDDNKAYKTLTDMDGEYFVYECRNKEGWDKYIPEAGMIVYHVDKSSRRIGIGTATATARELWDDWESTNCINENGSHPCFYIVPAGKQSSLNYTGSQFAFPGSYKATTFTPRSWNGVESEVTFSNIAYAENTVTFSVNVPSSDIDYPVIANPGNGTYAAGQQFAFELAYPEGQDESSVSEVRWFYDDEPVGFPSVALRPGAHTVEAQVFMATGSSMTVTLEITVE